MPEFIEVMSNARRMCISECCDQCPLNPGGTDPCLLEHAPIHEQYKLESLVKIEEIIMEWAKNHPPARYPTYREHLHCVFPNVNAMRIFSGCVCSMYGQDARPTRCNGLHHPDMTCQECWDREMYAKIAKELGAKKKQYMEETKK